MGARFVPAGLAPVAHLLLGKGPMTDQDHIYKKLEIVGSSTSTIEEAIRNALKRASESVHHLRWFEVVETRGDIKDGDVSHWQVTLKVGFTLDR